MENRKELFSVLGNPEYDLSVAQRQIIQDALILGAGGEAGGGGAQRQIHGIRADTFRVSLTAFSSSLPFSELIRSADTPARTSNSE